MINNILVQFLERRHLPNQSSQLTSYAIHVKCIKHWPLLQWLQCFSGIMKRIQPLFKQPYNDTTLVYFLHARESAIIKRYYRTFDRLCSKDTQVCERYQLIYSLWIIILAIKEVYGRYKVSETQAHTYLKTLLLRPSD